MNLIWIFGVALISLFASRILQRSSLEISQFLPLVGILLLLSALLPSLESILDSLQQLGQQAGLDSSSIGLVLRGVGIGLITHLAAGVCNDNGQRALGETVEYCGQIAIVSMAVPLISDLAKKLMEVKF